MKFLDKKTPQVEFDNIYEFIIVGMSNNKAKIVQVNGYGAIASNDKAANSFYTVRYTIYTSPGRTQRGLVVRAKYFSISHARGHRFRNAVSEA